MFGETTLPELPEFRKYVAVVCGERHTSLQRLSDFGARVKAEISFRCGRRKVKLELQGDHFSSELLRPINRV